MFCPYCGSEIEQDAVFCTQCGARIPTGDLNDIVKSQSKGRKPLSKRVVCLALIPVLLIAVIVVVFFATKSGGGTADGTYSDYLGNYEIQDEFAEKFYDNVLISVTEVDEETSTGTIHVTIPDLAQIYEDNKDDMQANLTTEQIQDIMEENLTECVIEESFECELYQDGDNWVLASTEQIDDLVVDVVDDYLKAVLADTQFTDINIDLSTEEATQ